MTIPAYLPYFVFAGTAAAVVAILYGLHRSLAQAKWPPSDRARTVRASAIILLGWLAVSIMVRESRRRFCSFASCWAVWRVFLARSSVSSHLDL